MAPEQGSYPNVEVSSQVLWRGFGRTLGKCSEYITVPLVPERPINPNVPPTCGSPSRQRRRESGLCPFAGQAEYVSPAQCDA